MWKDIIGALQAGARSVSEPEASNTPPRPAFHNPGAIFDSRDDAARNVLRQFNPLSVQQNKEYIWGFYLDPATGKYGYTDPHMGGVDHASGLPFSEGQVPRGMGHTHGNYSNGNIPTTRDLDVFDSDRFSVAPDRRMGPPREEPDVPFMRRGDKSWGYYLGTPSGKYRRWTPDGGDEPFE